jgi:beta-hydroxylase
MKTTGQQILRYTRKTVKRVAFLGLTAFFIPYVLIFYLVCGLLDVVRNDKLSLVNLDRYFFGNGFLTWLLSPFNLLMDLLTLPFRNKGVYELKDLPEEYQQEVQRLIKAVHERRIVEQLESRVQDGRSMIFFKWYGKNLETSIDVPEFHEPYKYVRTIGVSVFNKKQSTSEHFGPLRITLRVLYNINDMHDDSAYIHVGDRTNYWRLNKLFIFDDTLLHNSVNNSDKVRYCLFVDVLRPSLLPGVMNAILTATQMLLIRINYMFYEKWKMIR